MIYHNDPHLKNIDCTEVKRIIDHPLFQMLRFRRQLGLNFLIFPRAQHTRYDHSIGAFQRTRERMSYWRRDGVIDRDRARDVEIFGLIHDIGHGPYSHVIESVTKIDHDERGCLLLPELESAIRKCGGDFKTIERLFRHLNPLYRAVHDKNLGTEKFDYLERDSAVTNSGQPDFGSLPFWVTFKENELVVPYRDDLLEAALDIQRFYMKMYKNVYLHPDSANLHRWIQKLIFAIMQEGELTEDRLWHMADGDLDAAILNSKQPWVVKGMQDIRARQWPLTAISIKPSNFPEDNIVEHSHRVQTAFTVSMRRLRMLTQFFNHHQQRLDQAEKEIERDFKFPEHSITIIPLAETQRFKTQQVRVYKEGDGISNLSRWRPAGVDQLGEIADSYVCLRVAANPANRERLATPAISKAVVRYLFSKVS